MPVSALLGQPGRALGLRQGQPRGPGSEPRSVALALRRALAGAGARRRRGPAPRRGRNAAGRRAAPRAAAQARPTVAERRGPDAHRFAQRSCECGGGAAGEGAGREPDHHRVDGQRRRGAGRHGALRRHRAGDPGPRERAAGQAGAARGLRCARGAGAGQLRRHLRAQRGRGSSAGIAATPPRTRSPPRARRRFRSRSRSSSLARAGCGCCRLGGRQGNILVGVHKGFRELCELVLIDRMPKLVGVQAEGSSPIARVPLRQRSHRAVHHRHPGRQHRRR